MAKRFNVLVLLLIVAILLGGCSGPTPEYMTQLTPTPHIPGGGEEVSWMIINPPPGVETTCWAFFIRGSSTLEYHGVYHSYSGVYCLPPED